MQIRNLLFLCTGNSARSVLAEAIVNHWGQGRFRGYSAGSHPKGFVHPLALRLLSQIGMSTDGVRSKSWDEFTAPGAPVMDFLFTLCDQAAGEACPVWPGQPITAYWGVPDPAAVTGTEAEQMLAFRETFRILERRIRIFLSLPFEKLSRQEIAGKLAELGRPGRGAMEGEAS